MVKWQIILTKHAKKITLSGLKPQAKALLEILQENPYQPPYEKPIGNLAAYYSCRINIQHRLIYEILKEEIVRILKMWTHYE